ncbi:MAG: hypothetical protein KF782_13810 [Labilithrix sp.]|nr:hypothetical protein [Labilithrix sp.]
MKMLTMTEFAKACRIDGLHGYADAFERAAETIGRLEVEQGMLRDRVATLEATLSKLSVWARTFGEELKPRGADTYGEGVRDSKERVGRLLSTTSPMGEPGRRCKACSVEAEFGTEEEPHPVPGWMHTCPGAPTGQRPETPTLNVDRFIARLGDTLDVWAPNIKAVARDNIIDYARRFLASPPPTGTPNR